MNLIISHDGGTITDATLILDESVKSKRIQRALGSYLRQEVNTDPSSRKVRAIFHHSSHTDNLLQATDMACGAIYASYTRGNDAYLRIIQTTVQEIREWVPETQ